MADLTFPAGFLWGAATAAYQIEGAPDADGKGESVWDRFSHTPGAIKTGETGDVACDSYRRWRDDVALLRELGLTSYRFSVAWTRVQPDGRGPANAAGLDHYSRLVDGLLEAGVRPFPTLFHWDLPQALEDEGGWPNRDTADRFAEYAGLVARRLGDRLTALSLFNEPSVFTLFGYLTGEHAPGRRDGAAYLRATHTVNLAQGDGFRAVKAAAPGVEVGGAYALTPFEPRTGAEADAAGAALSHAFTNRWFLDPPLRGRYPSLGAADALVEGALGLRPGDAERMRAPLDFVGVNNYMRLLVSAEPVEGATPIGMPGFPPLYFASGADGPRTAMGWEYRPQSLRDAVAGVARDYADLGPDGRGPVVEVTENGWAEEGEAPDGTGGVRDERRRAGLEGFLRALHAAVADGARVRAYHVWTLLDNFEWAEGYRPRFGLAHVDFATGARTVKDSARWYAGVAARNGLSAEDRGPLAGGPLAGGPLAGGPLAGGPLADGPLADGPLADGAQASTVSADAVSS